MKVKHYDDVMVGDYKFHDNVSREVDSLLTKGVGVISPDRSNVKSFIRTGWNWEPDNITFRNLKEFIREEIERYLKPGQTISGKRWTLKCGNFWCNGYKKGDFANPHSHEPSHYSFSYFVKAKWYYSPLVFTDSGKRVRPKEGRYVIFPGHLTHHVPKHRYNNPRITLSGNLSFPDVV